MEGVTGMTPSATRIIKRGCFYSRNDYQGIKPFSNASQIFFTKFLVFSLPPFRSLGFNLKVETAIKTAILNIMAFLFEYDAKMQAGRREGLAIMSQGFAILSQGQKDVVITVIK